MSDKMSAFDQFINSFLSTVNKHDTVKKLVEVKNKVETLAYRWFD